ncbi:MAG: HD domain-containing phosphohydrolase [Nitrospirota bacterium]
MIPSRPRILCVDDEPMNLKVLEKMLVSSGYEAVKAEDGAAALTVIAENSVELVLLDVMMPKLDGFEVCRRIKGDERLRNIPVVMITALSAKEDRIRGIEAGAEDFISKPFDHGEVLARIKMLLKMKALNDSLNSAYDKITNLISFGEKSLLSFDPLTFDLMSKVDDIVSQLIRKTPEMAGKPQYVVVGVPDVTGVWQWHQYEFMGDRLNRAPITHDIRLRPDATGTVGPTVVYYNKADLELPRPRAFVKELGSLSARTSNMMCFLSEALCIVAVNYGRDVTAYDASVLNSFVMQSLFLRSLSGQIRETEYAFEYTVYALARAAEANDEDTGNHILRVGDYSAVIAEGLGMDGKFAEALRLQATLHDVGKIHVHPDILKKPGKLTPEEWVEMRKHTVHGATIIGEQPRLLIARKIASSHHERWDGGGYPQGLKGEQIPIEGRIMNIADQYDALRNRRVYKPAFDHRTTCKILTEGDGRSLPSHFDPKVLQVFKRSHTLFNEIYEACKD